MPFAQYDLEFSRDGRIFDEASLGQLLDDLPRLTDLFVISHGWNNDKAEADQLYDRLSASIEQVLGAGVVEGLDGRSFGVLRLFWPSKRFADEELIPGGGAASATNENEEILVRLLEALKRDPVRLGGQDTDPVREANLTRAQQLVARLEADAEARREFVFVLRAILDPAAAHPDDGSEEFFTRDPQELFAALKEPVVAPAGPAAEGATAVGTGGAAGLGDLLSGIKAAARRLANYTTYYEMKQRAGVVGRVGLAPVLRRLRRHKPELRLHLVGHSFGGRLVTAAAHALPAGTPRVSMTLLQAAYSHNGLGEKYDGINDGSFRAVLAEKRVSGPILITHTKNDRAVGIAYPLASRIARDAAAALGDENDPYGGMGRNGAQHTPEATGLAGDLEEIGRPYRFAAGNIFNLKADRFISDHSNVAGHQVAYAVLNAVRTI